MVTWIVWVCIAGLVFGIAGWLGIFIMPLLFLGWRYIQKEALLRREERAMDYLIDRSIDDGDAAAVKMLREMKGLIRLNLPLYLTQAAALRGAFDWAGMTQERRERLGGPEDHGS